MTSKKTPTPGKRRPRTKVIRGKKGQRFRSGFEFTLARKIRDNGLRLHYEESTFHFTEKHRYIPDFRIGKIQIEAKGRFLPRDRAKHLLVKEQNPDEDIRFVFMNAKIKLNKSSSTSYAEWCDKHGFQWAEGNIPDEWIVEAKEHVEERKRTPH